MSFSDAFKYALEWWWLLPVAIIILYAVIYILRALKSATSLYTYAVSKSHGFDRTLEPGDYFIWKPDEFIMKSPSLRYEVFDPDKPSSEPQYHDLLNPRTGKISLQIQVFKCPEFEITTADSKVMLVRAEMSFRLSREHLKYSLQYENFGKAIRSRIEEAFRDAIGDVENQKLGYKKGEIRRNILKFFEDTEKNTSHDNDSKPRFPLGIEVIDVTYHLPEAERFSVTTTESIKPGKEIGIRHMENIDPKMIDAIRDEFLLKEWDDPDKSIIDTNSEKLRHYRDANQIMLRILELQAEQNIARCLVSSGSLIVVSTDEMGMKGNLLREPMRKIMRNFIQSDD